VIDLAFSTLGQPGMSFDDLLDLTRASGARGIELRVADGELIDVHTGLDEAVELGARFADSGIVVIALASYVRLCREGTRAEDLAAHLRLAQAVGAGGVRVFPAAAPRDVGVSSVSPGEERAAALVEAVAPVISETEVTVLVESHDSHRSARDIVRLLDTIDAPGVAALWDTAHTWAAGESPAQSFGLLDGRLAHLQVKDVASREHPVPVPLGSGAYPVADLADVLRAADWSGWASLEWERAWHPELPPLTDALSTIRPWAAPLFRTDHDGHP
jgi:sugar phosphate isomerase/epimerase